MPDLESSLPQDVIDQLPEGFQIEVSNLSEEGQQQVIDAIANHDGDVSDLDTDQLVSDAQIADTARDNVEHLHQEQADAVASGDYAKADEIAHQTEYQLQEVQDHGGNAEQQLATTESDQQHLDWAQYHQDVASDQAQWAADAAQHGDATHAEMYGDMAAGHADTAATNATDASQGGHYGDHGYDSAASTGVDSSAATAHVEDATAVDTSSTGE